MGFAAKGIVYGIVGIIAVAVAIEGRSQDTAGLSGALRGLADSGPGTALLVALAIGLACYALYRLIEVFVGSETEHGDSDKLERVASVVRFVIYTGLCVSAIRILADAGGSSGQTPSQTTSTVFDLPAGVVLVFIAGLIVIGVGAYQAYKGFSQSFEDDLETSRMEPPARRAATILGVAGHAARAVVLALIGGFLIKAALEHDSKEALGLDGALQEIARQDYGTVLLFVVAAGLLLFGAYTLLESRYRRL